MKIWQRMAVGLALVMVSAAALAQMGPAAGTQARRHGGAFTHYLRLAHQLDFTAEQKTQLQTLLQSAQQQMKAIRENTALTDEQKREQVRSLMKQTRTDFSALLTPEQHAKVIAFANRPRGPMAALRGLNLTDAQKAQIKTLFEQQRAAMKALRQDTSLTPEQKMAQRKQLRQETHQKLLALLTPDQIKLLEQRRHKKGIASTTPTMGQ